ncbi:DUF1819 family protein [Promicromonospora sp. Marseille-Q5078]
MSAQASPRYALSFTNGGLLVREAAVVAPLYKEHRDWVKVRDLAVDKNLLQARAYRTSVRSVRETVKRMSALSDREVEIVADGTSTERGHLMWVAACRRYDLVGEFAEEVLRERFLTLAGAVSHEDYDSFYRAKALWHDELNAVSDTTYKKLRQVLFKMLTDAELLTAQGQIEPAMMSTRVAECLNEHAPSDVRFFPTRLV